MDPRSRRSRQALREAILRRAAERPIAELTVAAVCRDAGVTRDTFYRHADNPTDLLAAALRDELDAVAHDIDDAATLGSAERTLLAHVRERADVYRGALEPRLAAPIRAVLEDVVATGLAGWLERHPETGPDGPMAGLPRDIAVAYATGGTVAAIEAWLRSGADDVEEATRSILAASPHWWLR